MAATDRDAINASMGGSQDASADDYQSAMGGWQPSAPGAAQNVLLYSNGVPLTYSDGVNLEYSA